MRVWYDIIIQNEVENFDLIQVIKPERRLVGGKRMESDLGYNFGKEQIKA